MSQDQIAKLMAIAGRQVPANEPARADEPAAEERLLGEEPPLLENEILAKSASRAQPAGEAPPRRVARRRPAGPVRGKIAANDDVPSIGGLIYALEQKPSARIFRVAAIASVLWGAAGLAFGALSLAPTWSAGAPLSELLLHPIAFYTTAATLVPIAIFWLLALLNWHIATLALKSSTMTEVAIRLAEPDRAAEQSIASLGQAVRRQVSFMNDAVSRALGRAGELEALVHNQVADLERSYEENERRIRGLIQELTGERHALLNTSTSVTDTLKTLGTEIPTLIEKLSTQQVTLASIIKGAGENLANLEGSLAASTGRFESAVGTRTQQLQTVLEDYTTAFSTALGTRTEQMRVAFDGYMHTLDTSLGNRTENLQTVFEEYARALDIQLIERTRSLDDAFQRRLELFDDQIHRSTTAIDSAVSEKASLLTSALEAHASSFRDTMGRQAADLDESVMHGINAVRRTSENITRQTMKAIEGLSQQSHLLQNVSENLFSQIHGVTGRFENQGEQILRVASQLDDANMRIDSTLQSRHADLTRTIDKLSGKADEFGRTLAGYSSNIEGSLSDIETKARTIAEELRDGSQARSRALLAELDRVKLQTEAESERTLSELRGRFQSVSGELSREFDTLSSRLSSASDETRMRAAEAAETLAREQARLREESARLPANTRDTAEAMRRALQDQMRALDHLAQLSGRVAGNRDVTRPDGALPPPPNLSRAIPTLAAVLAQDSSATSRARPAGGAGEQREGWSLGDLLARASHDDDAQASARSKPTPTQPFRLDVGTIARAVDPATASAIWARLRAGQRNVMVRSIYTPEARAVFDQIASRVKTDGELAQTVLRYLSDFERIIKDADGRDPSGRLAQTHLTSETGRVYLFLGHAVGRIG